MSNAIAASPTSVIASSHPTTAGTRKVVKRSGFTRQRRGCLTCRQRKKKCDQSLPICGHCSRLNLVCRHEKPRELPQQQASGSSSSKRGHADAEQPPAQLSASSSAQWEDDREQHRRPSLSRVGEQASEVLRLAKIYEPLDLLPADPSVSNDLVSSRRTMMRYYTTTLAIMLSATGENNYFLSVLLPMAFDCPPLLDAMAAWSSAHLALQYPSLQDTALQHRGRALSNLTASLKTGTLTSEMCLAVAMAMCSMDTISVATSSSWSHHLAGAAAALQSKSSNLQAVSRSQASHPYLDATWLQSFEGKWLLRNFAYHDILMSVSLDRRPLIAGDYWMSTDDATADPYFAFASKIMLLTSEISVLNADCTEQFTCGAGSGQPSTGGVLDAMDELAADSDFEVLLRRAYSLATSLREWELPTTVSGDEPLALLSETYRSAALIYLDRVVRKHFPHYLADVIPEGVQLYVASICDIAQKIPEGSLSECSLLFPIFIAGGEAEDEQHIECLRNRLFTMNKWRKFRNVDACREVLEQVWRCGDEYRHGLRPDRVDWRDVLEQKGWQLALS